MAYSPYGPRPARSAPVDDPRVPHVVHMSQEDHPALANSLLRSLQTERAKYVTELLLAKDWADYEKRRGLIHGIDQAIALCQATQDKLTA